jgi:hypothetical protein
MDLVLDRQGNLGVVRWGIRLQAIEALHQAETYGSEEPENLDPNHS